MISFNGLQFEWRPRTAVPEFSPSMRSSSTSTSSSSSAVLLFAAAAGQSSCDSVPVYSAYELNSHRYNKTGKRSRNELTPMHTEHVPRGWHLDGEEIASSMQLLSDCHRARMCNAFHQGC